MAPDVIDFIESARVSACFPLVMQVRRKLTVKKFILIQTRLQSRRKKTTGREKTATE